MHLSAEVVARHPASPTSPEAPKAVTLLLDPQGGEIGRHVGELAEQDPEELLDKA